MKEIIGKFFLENPKTAAITSMVIVAGTGLLAYGIFGNKSKLSFTKDGIEASHKKHEQSVTSIKSKKGKIKIEQKNEGNSDDTKQTIDKVDAGDGESVEISQANQQKSSNVIPSTTSNVTTIEEKKKEEKKLTIA